MAKSCAPRARPTRTAARTAAFMPGESPPLVNTPMRIAQHEMDFVGLQLRVKFVARHAGERVFVYGDAASLGYWDEKRALALHQPQLTSASRCL